MQDDPQEVDTTTSTTWYLYILRCSDGSLYTGVTTNVERRFRQHTQGTASRYTRSRRPLTLLYQESCSDRSVALSREYAVKSLSRKNKEALISSSASGAISRGLQSAPARRSNRKAAE